MRNNNSNNNAFNLISQKPIPTIKDAVLCIEIPEAATPESHISKQKTWSVFITCYHLSWFSVVSLALTQHALMLSCFPPCSTLGQHKH